MDNSLFIHSSVQEMRVDFQGMGLVRVDTAFQAMVNNHCLKRGVSPNYGVNPQPLVIKIFC